MMSISENTQKKTSAQQQGFTLIELLVVIALVGIMTMVMIASLRDGRDTRAVDAVARQVAATIRMAQGYAVAGRYMGGGRIPCTFRFFANSASGTYGVRYTYHTKTSTTCTTTPTPIVTYSTANNVAISQVNDMTFTIPQGTVTGAGRVTLSRGSATTSICVDGFGRVHEGC